MKRTRAMVKKYKRDSAAERQDHWNSLTPEQKLSDLDLRLGKGVGAKKQRARIAKQLSESA